MGIGRLGNALEVLSNIFSGLGGETRQQIIMQSTADSFTIPVTPRKISFSMSQNNKTVNITQVGEALLFGQPKLHTVSWSCFFPATVHDYPFVVGDRKDPSECINLIKKWKEAKNPIRVIVTETPINLMMGITDMQCAKQDGSGDIYYTINLLEYKALNTPTANNNATVDQITGLKARPTETIEPTQATLWQKGSDIMDAAKKAYGDYNHWRRIVQSNDLKDLAINNVSKLRKLRIK
ncbi:hypothetical protein [Megasphaera vaginalis (ex Srinivasan et al. 2021)]|uniref:Uncharacterized protein n=1 Tax=Megasphaera vaginalis (ex Srinivasan et al. 2021) TaxID=1111454 RepID=U7UJ64_9FIRM|nr:hypothetical protein [Megasphaera vaginalis (ex Srinivasan et al. 2021)]ERT59336.1 hypothetical protein HMPREF1250_0195 [Megasphaera vaginalis (ex Srinivasan et al. 2021)]